MRAVIVLALVLALLAAALPVEAQRPDPLPCRGFSLHVALSEGALEEWTVRGRICGGDAPRDRAVQVLTAGATESGIGYWDFGGHGRADAPYSYARWLAERGYASVVLDRIGTGGSDRPAAIEVTIASNAFVVHQVVAALRAGELGVQPFAKVVGVGRSLGGPILWTESSAYHDLDGIVVQSFSRHQQPGFFQFPAALMPAQLEPRFADSPPGYLTTRAGARAELFFHLPNADPAVVAAEERAKDTMTAAEIATFPPSFSSSEAVDVPVLVQLGDRDSFFCTAPGCPETATEASYFPQSPSVDTHVVLDAGHDINLQRNGPSEAFPALLRWVAQR